MYWETLPSWVWFMYYFFLIVTLGTALFSVTRKQGIGLSIIAIVFTLTVPIISLINSIDRSQKMNEFEHFVTQLQQGASWSIYAIIGYTYLLFWWVRFLNKNNMKMDLKGEKI